MLIYFCYFHHFLCILIIILQIYPKKETHTVGFTIFFGSNFPVTLFLPFCSLIIYQFMSENSFDLVQIGVSNRGVIIKCHKCFNMKYGNHQRADTLRTANALDIKRNTCSMSFPFSLPRLCVKITINKVVNDLQLIWRGW